MLSSKAQESVRGTYSSLNAFQTIRQVKQFEKECQNYKIQNGDQYNALFYLGDLLDIMGVQTEEILEWLAKYIRWAVPVIELGVKGILLAQTKARGECLTDILIPDWARTEGFTYDLRTLDPLDKLVTSPLTKNNHLYFGTNGCSSPYHFLRPRDMDSFLWYVIHKGKYVNHSYINSEQDFIDQFQAENIYSWDRNNKIDFNMLKPTTIVYKQDSNIHGIVLGNSFKGKIENSALQQISVCALAEYANNVDGTQTLFSNTLLPTTSEWNRTTYYVNRPTYFNFLDVSGRKDKEDNTKRYFDKDTALCSFRYLNDRIEIEGETTKYDATYKDYKLNMKILPKPFIHYPQQGQVMLLPKRILFDADGNPNQNGSFTINPWGLVGTPLKNKAGDLIYGYAYAMTNNGVSAEVLYIDIYGNYDIYSAPILQQDGTYKLEKLDRTKVLPYLVECYPNMTIYEFNYDFIFGMQLFESKAIIEQLIKTIIGYDISSYVNNISLGLNTNQIITDSEIEKIVENAVMSDDYMSDNCFFTFDNQTYDEMLAQAEEMRLGLSKFNGNDCEIDTNIIDKILQEIEDFGNDATLSGSVSHFTNIINYTSAIVERTEGTESNHFNIKVNGLTRSILLEALTALVKAIIKSLLTPKLILLLMVNEELNGNIKIKNLNFKQLLYQIKDYIFKIINEIVNYFIQEIKKWVMEKLKEIINDIKEIILYEQIKAYQALIKKMINACKINSYNLDTILDVVDYADIDKINEDLQPSTDKC